jgi:hypothetical protein
MLLHFLAHGRFGYVLRMILFRVRADFRIPILQHMHVPLVKNFRRGYFCSYVELAVSSGLRLL